MRKFAGAFTGGAIAFGWMALIVWARGVPLTRGEDLAFFMALGPMVIAVAAGIGASLAAPDE